MLDVEVKNLRKTYNKGSVLAVNDVSFSVEKGELFGLIGPDGAGKTSIFRVLTTLLLADAGTIYINGLEVVKNFKEIRNNIGYMPGRFSLYQDLTVEENLNFFATVFNTTLEENYELIKEIYIQIEPFKDRRAGKLSGGMKQKLALCCALIHKPKILFLDEPTTGVDTVSRKEFWEMLKRLKKAGITILVSTPYMDEASLCERIALIQNGDILTINTPSKIIDQYNDNLYAIKSSNIIELLSDLREYSGISNCNAFGEYLHINFTNDSEAELNKLKAHLTEKQHTDIIIKKVTPSIEDCFIKLMKK